MTSIWVLDTETTTTTFDPEPDGHIIEVGVALARLEEGTVHPMLSMVVYPGLGAPERCWAYENTSVSRVAAYHGVTRNEADYVLSHLMMGGALTTYNMAFDMTMIRRDLPETYDKVLRHGCIMEAASKVAGIPLGHGGQYPTLEQAYIFLGCQPEVVQEHRALPDAVMAAKILVELYKRGLYDDRVRWSE